MKQKIYLTIDDAPSMHMKKKVDFLNKKKIPAIFYVRGEFIEKHKEPVIYGIKHGFLMGNHSYSHPYFSTISFEECKKEILLTENLIEECYRLAEEVRVKKVIRFPFADRGKDEKALQEFLQEKGFESLPFQKEHDDYIDSLWDLDPRDYKRKYINDSKQYIDNFKNILSKYNKEKGVLLLHDFNDNHHLFELIMDLLISVDVEFLSLANSKNSIEF